MKRAGISKDHLLFLCLTAGLLAACSKGKTGIDLPRYPGASYMALEAVETPEYTIYGAALHTPDVVPLVNKFYKAEIDKLGEGWEGSTSDQFGGEYSKNMEWAMGDKHPKPKDPARRASYIRIEIDGSIMLYDSVPKKKE